MNRILASLLILSVTACGGVSEQEIAANNKRIAAYEKEIKTASRDIAFNLDSAKEFLVLEQELTANGIYNYESSAQEYSDKAGKKLKYKKCLEEYMEINEPYPIAKTSCTERAGLNQ